MIAILLVVEWELEEYIPNFNLLIKARHTCVGEDFLNVVTLNCGYLDDDGSWITTYQLGKYRKSSFFLTDSSFLDS